MAWTKYFLPFLLAWSKKIWQIREGEIYYATCKGLRIGTNKWFIVMSLDESVL